jgi:hypothetical protein
VRIFNYKCDEFAVLASSACLYDTKILTLSPRLTAAQAVALVGMQATPHDYDALVTEDADVYDQEGHMLLKFRKAAIAPDVLDAAVKAVGSYVRAATPSLRTACVRAPA